LAGNHPPARAVARHLPTLRLRNLRGSGQERSARQEAIRQYRSTTCARRGECLQASGFDPKLHAARHGCGRWRRHARGPHEEWIAADPFKRGFLITGPQGFERTVVFALDEGPAVIAERVRQTMEQRSGILHEVLFLTEAQQMELMANHGSRSPGS